MAVNPATPADVLRKLAEDKSWLVRESVMRNRLTPWVVLTRAAQSDPCPRVRSRAEKTVGLVTGSPLDGAESDLIEVDGGRPHVLVPFDLGSLQGPLTGTRTLPIRIDGSATGGGGGRVYDLSDDREVEAMYRVVLTEATLQADLFSMVNRESLVRIWSSLRIPAYTREIWEFRFPELGGVERGARLCRQHFSCQMTTDL